MAGGGRTQEVPHLAVVETGLPFEADDGSLRAVQGQEKSETSTRFVYLSLMVSVPNVRELVKCPGATARHFTVCFSFQLYY